LHYGQIVGIYFIVQLELTLENLCSLHSALAVDVVGGQFFDAQNVPFPFVVDPVKKGLERIPRFFLLELRFRRHRRYGCWLGDLVFPAFVPDHLHCSGDLLYFSRCFFHFSWFCHKDLHQKHGFYN
jgi:hypothetical protein